MFKIFAVFKTNAILAGKLEVAEAQIRDLKDQVAEHKDEYKTLMDWLLYINGAPSAFRPEARPDKSKLNGGHAPAPDIGTARNARDFQRLAESALNMPIPNLQGRQIE